MARPITTVVIRYLNDRFTIDTWQRLYRDLVDEGYAPQEFIVSASDWVGFGNLLVVRGMFDGARLAFNGCPVVQMPRWPVGTIGIIVTQD